MSTMTSGKRRLGPLADAAAVTAGSRIVGAAKRAVSLIVSAIAHRAERRLLRELDALDDRLLDDIGIDCGRLGLSPYRHEATRRELVAHCMN